MGSYLMGTESWLCKMKGVLQMDGDCTAMWILLNDTELFT